MHFDAIGRVPGDPILGLMELYAQDPNPLKFDLGVGVYKDDQGLTPIPHSVKLAEQRLVEQQTTKTYIGGHGNAAFGSLISELVLGAGSPLLGERRAGATQTPGGTGALRLSADFIAHSLPGRGVWLSNPTWPIHETIFAKAGLKVSHYPYVGSDNRLDVAAMLATLSTVPKGDVVLLHACCHNPTGVDLSPADWQQVLDVVKAKNLVPFLDMAYQGFGDGIDEDAAAVRLFAESGLTFFVSSSFSKSFSLYGERVGALSIVTDSKEESARILSQVKRVIRTNYSNPPTHGAAIVAAVLNNPELRAQWEAELAEMRLRIRGMREQMVADLAKAAPGHDFSFVGRQRGMFSYSGLSVEQVTRLRSEFGIYALDTGRICVAALNQKNIDAVTKAIVQVL